MRYKYGKLAVKNGTTNDSVLIKYLNCNHLKRLMQQEAVVNTEIKKLTSKFCLDDSKNETLCSSGPA